MLVGAFYPGPFTCESPLCVNGLNQILYTMDKASLPEDDVLPKLSSGVTFLGTVLPGKTNVKKPSVQLVPFHILCHKVLTHAAGPHSPLAFSSCGCTSPSFALYVIHQTQSKWLLELLSLSLHVQTVAPDADHNSAFAMLSHTAFLM